MNLDDVRLIRIARQKKHRVGRGSGSGWGVTSGRGNKGAGARSGAKHRLQFEGGQMPIYRRLPKKGFTNSRFQTPLYAVNVGQIARNFDAGDVVSVATLKAAGLAPKNTEYVKILGDGELDKPLSFEVHGISVGAREKVEAKGGSVIVLPTEVAHREKFVKKDGSLGGAGAKGKAAKSGKPGGARRGGN